MFGFHKGAGLLIEAEIIRANVQAMARWPFVFIGNFFTPGMPGITLRLIM